MEEQGFLDDRERWGKMLALVPEAKRKMLEREWEERPRESGRDRWRRLWTEVQVGSLQRHVLAQTLFASLFIFIGLSVCRMLQRMR